MAANGRTYSKTVSGIAKGSATKARYHSHPVSDLAVGTELNQEPSTLIECMGKVGIAQ